MWRDGKEGKDESRFWQADDNDGNEVKTVGFCK